MGSFLAKHRQALLVAIAVNATSLGKGILWAWDWLARLYFAAHDAPGLLRIGPAISFLTNPPPWTVFVTGFIGVVIVLWDIRYPNFIGRTVKKARMTFLLIAAVACLLGAATFGTMAYRSWKYPPSPEAVKSELLTAAETDFRTSGGIAEEKETVSFVPQSLGAEVTVLVWVRSDLVTMGRFLVFYVPQTIDLPITALSGMPKSVPTRLTFEVIKQMADRFTDIMQRVDARGSAGTNDMGMDNWRDSTQTVFTGAIYIYYEGDLNDSERVQLRGLYKERGAKLYFRNRRHLIERRPPPQG